MIDELALLAGVDIPFPAASISIHQPTLKEIAYIGETNFFIGCELLNFSKDLLFSEDKEGLDSQTNFDIIVSIIRKKNDRATLRSSIGARMVLSLLFPEYNILVQKKEIVLSKNNDVGEKEEFYLNSKNFDEFQKILSIIFCLRNLNGQEYNPSGSMAKEIAEKIRKGRMKRAEIGTQSQKIAIYSRYASILAVGENKDLNSLMQYTVYQLFDEFTRYELKLNHDYVFKARLAGAKGMEEAENWLKDIHE